MAPKRRRSRSVFPVAVLGALVAAIFAARSAYTSQLAQAARTRTSVPVTVPSPARTPASSAEPAAQRQDENRSPGFTSRQRLVEHFEKHGAEFPGLDQAGYLRAAQVLRDAVISDDVLEIRRPDGVISRFDRRTGSFLAVNRDGTIRTFFRPNDGEAYFRRQALRSPGGGP
jgi:hypothetical protein